MRILSIQPAADPGSGPSSLVATFNLEVNDGLRLMGLRLVKSASGRTLVYAPSKNGLAFASFAGDYARQIVAAASAALHGGCEPDERHLSR